MDAFADHGEVLGDQSSPATPPRAARSWTGSPTLGIDYDDVIAVLETEGVDKFVNSWDELTDTVPGSMEQARA